MASGRESLLQSASADCAQLSSPFQARMIWCLFAENICQGWMRDIFWKKFQSFGGLPIESEGSQSHEIPLKRQPSSAQCLVCLQVMMNSDLLSPEVSIPLGHWTMLRIVEERVLRQP